MTEILTVFKRSPSVVAATVGDKSFLLQIEDWVYLELNESGSRIWELLDEGKTVQRIVEEMDRYFHVDREACTSDTSEFLASLEAKHFVTRN